ncbi:alpha/beta fold hydrolase [Pendulispora albinea]|uniref:Alpha/beta fold hydrolase n=1 Tax=Pendulispora albinea TaxID=2741071 RepID=A0ABZ2MA49_9BACT
MNDAELLDHVHALGGKLWLDGDAVRYSAPRGSLLPELMQALRTRKDGIRDLLRARGSARAAATVRDVQAIPRAPRGRRIPLSFAQHQLWFIDQLEPGPLYNVVIALRLKGRLDVAALERACDTIAARHESLRTTFPHERRVPYQHIHEAAGLPIAQVDLSALPEDAREREAERLLAEESARPFDLAKGPLVRVLRIQLGEDEHALVLGMHHIISDGWSLGVLVRELGALYPAFARGASSPLPELPIQFADYAIWQRAYMAGARLEEHLAYFREALRDVPPLELATDFPRPAAMRHRGGELRSTIDRALADASNGLARREGATLFMVLLSVFQVLLGRRSGQDDFAVGVPVAGRGRTEIEPLIGDFVNLMPIRSALRGAPSFRGLVARVREATLEAFQRQDVPFARLVEELVPTRDPSRPPLVQAVLVLQNDPLPSLDMDGLSVRRMALPRKTAKFDLLFAVTETAEGLDVGVEYSQDLFAPETVQRLLEHFRALLADATSRPDEPLGVLAPAFALPEPSRPAPEEHDPRRTRDGGELQAERGRAAPPRRELRATLLPRDPLELTLAEIWEDLLGVRPIGVHDDFFARGGHSLSAMTMLARIEQRIGRSLSSAELVRHTTIEALAGALREEAGGAGAPSALVTLEARGKEPALYCVHAVGGSALSYLPLARALGAERPIHAFNARGRDDDGEPIDDVDTMAEHYASLLAAHAPDAPVWLLAWSFGGVVAVAMARKLEAAKVPVAGVILLDSRLPGHGDEGPGDLACRVLFAREHALALTLEDMASLEGPGGDEALAARARAQGVLPAKGAHAQVTRALRVYAANLRAFAAHRAKPTAATIALVRPEELGDGGPPLAADPTGGWNALARAPVAVRVAPGDHFSMLRPPHVARLAAIVRELVTGAGEIRRAP